MGAEQYVPAGVSVPRRAVRRAAGRMASLTRCVNLVYQTIDASRDDTAGEVDAESRSVLYGYVLLPSLSEQQQIQQWVDAHGTPQQVAQRCRIVLTSGEGQSDVSIKIFSKNRRGAQPLQPIPALGDRLPGLLDGRFQRLPGFGGAIRQRERHRVKLQQHSLKTLQQRIVQIARDAGALAAALFQTHV